MPGQREAEESIYEMLLADEPDMPDDERRQLARDGAKLAAEVRFKEMADGWETDILCVCGAPQSRHVGGAGRCKDQESDCESFVPDRVSGRLAEKVQ